MAADNVLRPTILSLSFIMAMDMIDLLALATAVSFAIATWYSMGRRGKNDTLFLRNKGQNSHERPLGG